MKNQYETEKQESKVEITGEESEKEGWKISPEEFLKNGCLCDS